MAYYNQIPASEPEKMATGYQQQREFEFPAKTTTATLRTLSHEEFYRKILMNYIYPRGHEWFVISLNVMTFIFGVLGGV